MKTLTLLILSSAIAAHGQLAPSTLSRAPQPAQPVITAPALPPGAAAPLPVQPKRNARLEVRTGTIGSKTIARNESELQSLRTKVQTIALEGTITTTGSPYAARLQWWIFAKVGQHRSVSASGDQQITLGAGQPYKFEFGDSYNHTRVQGSGTNFTRGEKYEGYAVRITGPTGELLDAAGSTAALKAEAAAGEDPFPAHVARQALR